MHVSLICRCIVGEIKETGHLSRIASRSIEYINVSAADNETIRRTQHRLYVSTNFILSHVCTQGVRRDWAESIKNIPIVSKRLVRRRLEDLPF